MRGCSGQIRVVEKLSGGAHLLLPGSEATVAIRTYYLKDLEKLEAVGSVTADCLDEWNRGAIPKRGIPELDGLSSFRDAFQHPVVFFVLPTDKSLDDHLGRPHSFVNCAQMIMNRWGTDGVNTRREQTYQVRNRNPCCGQDASVWLTKLIEFVVRGRLGEVSLYRMCRPLSQP